MVKRILIPAVLYVACLGILCTDQDNAGNSERVSIVPEILWKRGGILVSPDEVDSVRLTVTSPSLASDRVSTFSYSLHEGIIDRLPTGISLTLKIEGLDTNGVVAYSGMIDVPNLSGEELSIQIQAIQVSPLAPDSVMAQAKSCKTISITWRDRSSNETNFILERKETHGGFDTLAQIIENSASFLDTGLTPYSSYSYRVCAVNTAGKSGYLDTATAMTLSLSINSAPYFSIHRSQLEDSLAIGEMYCRRLLAYDDDSDNITVTASSVLTVVSVDSIQWTPALRDTGWNSFWVKVTDDSAAFDSIGFSIYVSPRDEDTAGTNTFPYFDIEPLSLSDSIFAGQRYARFLRALDADGDSLTFSAGTPLSINSLDTLWWIPTASDTGINSCWVKVADYIGAFDSIGFALYVKDSAAFTSIAVNLDSGLAAWYPLNENSNDASGNGNHGTLHGAVPAQDRFGASQGCYMFDGIDDYIVTSNIGLHSEYTISCWVKMLEDSAGDNTIIDYGDRLGQIRVNPVTGIPWYYVQAANHDPLNDRTVLGNVSALNRWTHLVAIVHSNTMSFYIDGVIVGANTEGTITTSTNTSVHIGSEDGVRYFLRGLVDDVRIYNRAITIIEIDSLYNLDG